MEYEEYLFSDSGRRHFVLSEDNISVTGKPLTNKPNAPPLFFGHDWQPIGDNREPGAVSGTSKWEVSD